MTFKTTTRRCLPGSSFMLRTVLLAPALLAAAFAQAPPPAAARQMGTVKAVTGNTLTIANAAGVQVTVTVAPGATVLQLPPGSTDLKAAQPATLADVLVGDRVSTGKSGDTDTASRVILMKSSDIAARKQTQQADWQKRGTGGIVKAVDGSTLTVSAGTHSLKVETTPTTIFRRYADDSVNFEETKPGTLDQIRPGDQLSVRGAKSDDGESLKAEEVVTGTFSNLSGAVAAVNAADGTITLKDLISKKTVIVKVTANSDVRKLPAAAAAAFASRTSGVGGGKPGGDMAPRGETAGGRPGGAGGQAGGQPGPGGPGGPGGPRGEGGPRNAGMDLSRMLARLPTATLADLKAGDAVMIVASQGHGSEPFTAITLLAGVEQLLSATPSGSQPITLSPWNLGAPEGGGGGGGR